MIDKLEGSLADAYAQQKEELEMLESVPEKDRDYAWKKAVTEAKKGVETILFQYVSGGCLPYAGNHEYFPALVGQYDPDSYDLLDEKIEFLSRVAKEGPDCDVESVPGFGKVIEDRVPKGVQLTTND